MTYLLQHYLAESVARDPHRPAVQWRDIVLSYGELDDLSTRLAILLAQEGIGPGTRVGMYLPKPARLTIDQGEPHSVPYTWCLTNACIAGAVATPKMVEEMASGQTLRLEFVDSSLLTLTTSLPLGQFASIHKGAPAQTFEQDIDE